MADILLVEPDLILAKTYYQALTNTGHEVVATAGAQAAIIAADVRHPDLVILELQLVEHSGIEFLYEFRSYQEWQSIPVIIQTQVPPGEFNANRQLLKEQLGVAAYIYKPHSSLRGLIDIVNDHLPVKA
jgi:DNA-binding response OmpR family regulator